MRNGRKPARPPFRFTEVKKLEIKNKVTTSPKNQNGDPNEWMNE